MRIGIVAGEESGDLLAAELIRAMRARAPDLELEGIVGARMIQAGCKALAPAERLAVMGLFEVLGRYRELHALRSKVASHFIRRPPDVFIGVDAPDFNLGLERALRRAGIPTVHYVSPTVWAWRRYRIKKIARSVDLMLTLFPFEADFYARHQDTPVPVRFVGHPLADSIALEEQEEQRCSLRAGFGFAADAKVVALLPGSRAGEVARLAQPFLETALWLAQRRPGVQFVAPMANSMARELFDRTRRDIAPHLSIVLLDGRAQDALRAADVVLLASGTATLEALLLKRPMVVAYRVAALTAFLLKRFLLKTPYFSLPNLLAGRALIPEFSQSRVTAENLGAALLRYLDEPGRVAALREDFNAIHRALRRNASEQAAQAVLELLGAQGGRSSRRPASRDTGTSMCGAT
jgi:lipid-A-disaccharide synthase